MNNDLGRRRKYIKWLAHKVDISVSGDSETSYVRLMNALYDKEFYSTVGMDENRIEDGLSLREEYCGDEGSEKLCSLLEVMVALALRCEREILAGVATGSDVFWDMLDNLGLIDYTDYRFDGDEVDYILDRLLDREYEKDGRGGLFYLGKSGEIDMREEEIWWQMNIYALRKYEHSELY